MAWEVHGGQRYYYRSRREAGRVVRDFIGNGMEAHLADSLVQERRRRQQEDLRLRRQALQVWRTANRLVDALIEVTDLLVGAFLVVAGFHQRASASTRKSP